MRNPVKASGGRVVAVGGWWRARSGRQRALVLLVIALTATSSFLGWRVYQLTRPEPEFLCGHLPTTQLVPIVGYQPRQHRPPFIHGSWYSCTIVRQIHDLSAPATSIEWEFRERDDMDALYLPTEKLKEIAANDSGILFESDIPGHPEAFLYIATRVPCVHWVNQTHAVRACADLTNEDSTDQRDNVINQLRTLILAHATKYIPDQPTPSPSPKH
ncbi:Uncharacterised protein [Actinomyces bovis]|uniref:DUF3105 domain-containing protein n=1 Tax=Actinomyces bovis TaxID=1658 RepID=A0ABY1VNE1_9ACTO|nr:Uncharacterised protein [Actinomyces bovis]VEG55643.1 Uncharacterised protein [Actinomyces israelii]